MPPFHVPAVFPPAGFGTTQPAPVQVMVGAKTPEAESEKKPLLFIGTLGVCALNVSTRAPLNERLTLALAVCAEKFAEIDAEFRVPRLPKESDGLMADTNE